MKYIYKITGKVSLILYIFMLYQFWHLCQYGGLRRHIPMLALGIIGLVGTVVLWLISKRHNQEVNSGDNGNKKLFYTEMILLIAATLFFGGRIVYSAVPYHGALSWKLDEWMRKKEVELEHNNLFEDGVEGILMDLDEALQLPEELYIANKYQVSFDENGTIQRIYAFIYGKNEAGEKKTYLIDYDADSSNDMTVWRYTDDGYLMFSGTYFSEELYVLTLSSAEEHVAFRILPLVAKCRELNEKYLLPIGYELNNMF
jgi:hypothetical protein